MSIRAALAILIALAVGAPASAQIPLFVPIPGKKAKPTVIGPPPDATPYEAEVWPFPPPDPMLPSPGPWPKPNAMASLN